MDVTVNVKAADLLEYCKRLMMAQGLTEEDSYTIADSLVDAEMCGVVSHGVSRMQIYTKRLETGVVSNQFKVEIEQEYAGSAVINACNSMGMPVGKYAMEMCIKKAKESGCCFIAVNHSNHYGMAAYYVKMAAKENMIGITGTNAPPNIAPTGSSKPYVGTNPVAIGIPTNGHPIVLDMAPSVVAMGKVILAAKLGHEIPLGWALTKEGKPTTDPELGRQGSVLPIGGPKGYGLSLMMDIFSGILSGATFGPHLGNMFNDFVNQQNVGHIFCVLDVSKFTDMAQFKACIDQMRSEIKALPKNDGVSEIFLPGEIEQHKKESAAANGIVLSEVVYNELKELGIKYGVACII